MEINVQKFITSSVVKDATTTDMFNSVWQIVSAVSELEEAVKCLDYANPERSGVRLKDVVEDTRLLVYVNEGGSEGVYIDALLRSSNGTCYEIGTLKTLEEGPEAFMKMGLLSGILTWGFERYLREFL